MKIEIIGAQRRNNGIGEYIARYLHVFGAQVAAVVSRSANGAYEAATVLSRYGMHPAPFDSFGEMIRTTRPDAVVVASPTPTHRHYLELCCEAGVSVLCDKPFVSPQEPDAIGFVEDVLTHCKRIGTKVSMNSQWPFSIPHYEKLCGHPGERVIESFFMRLSPSVRGIDMIPDSLPHALSVLYCSVGPGRVLDVFFEKGDDTLRVTFTYEGAHARVPAKVELEREVSQPRTFAFGFNGRIATRTIDAATYTISLEYEGNTLVIPDPLESSVRDFLEALQGRKEPLIGADHIMDTTRNLCEIYERY